jgi:hypothetical protein
VRSPSGCAYRDRRETTARPVITVDVSEIRHKPLPARAPRGDQTVIMLKTRIESLEAEIAKIEISAVGHCADFERERDRADRLVTELLKATADLMAAREVTARLEGEIAALRPKPKTWWQWLRSTGT